MCFWRTLGLVGYVYNPKLYSSSRLNSGLEFAVDCTTKNYAVTFVPVVRLQMFAVNFLARFMGDVWGYAYIILSDGCSCIDTALAFAIVLY